MRPDVPDSTAPAPPPTGEPGTATAGGTGPDAGGGGFGWGGAWARGVLIFLAVVLATVALPSWLAGSRVVSGRSETVSGAIVATVWLVVLVLVMWALRRLQRRGRI